MKATTPRRIRRALLAVIVVGILGIAIVAFFIPFRPPSRWAAIKPGVSRDVVRAIIPEFDQPWADIKADFEYERSGVFTWRLAVTWQDDQVRWVEKELWTSWPEQRRLRTIFLQ
jgi:hypothetical protein